MAAHHRNRRSSAASAGREASRVCALLLLITAAALAGGQPLELHENFASADARDDGHTTAHWNTEARQLELHRHEIEPRARFEFGPSETARDLVVAGTLAFVTSDFGTTILDIRGAESPSMLATISAPGEGLAVAAGHLFIADPAGFLHVVDVRDPSTPQIVASYEGVSGAQDVVIAGPYAFVADGDAGLRILDARQPAEPVSVANLGLEGQARDLKVAGQLVFVAAGEAGVLCVDVHDVGQPQLVGSFDTDGSAAAIDIDGDYLYVADGDARQLLILDLTDPGNLGLIASYETSGPAVDVVAISDYVYVAGSAGVDVVDVIDTANPRRHDFYATPVTSIQVLGSSAYAIAGSSFSILDVADLVDPATPVARIETPDQSFEVLVAGEYAFVPDYLTGLLVFDIQDPSRPRRVVRFNTPGLAVDIALAGDVAYVADHRAGGIRVLDIRDPIRPQEIGSYAVTSAAVAVETAGDLLCVGFIHDGLSTFDVSDPADPRFLGNVAAGSVRDIALDGTIAYVADNDEGLRVVDLSDPVNPQILATRSTSGRPTGVDQSGAFVYLADGQGGVQVFEARDPANPVWIATAETPGYPFKLEVLGDHLFVADHVAGGLQFLDVSDPAAPRVVTGYVTGFYADGVAVAGDHGLLSDGQGLQIVRAFTRRPFVDRDSNQARSTVISAGEGTIVLVALQAAQQGDLRWQISASSGASWQDLPADGSWTPVELPGDSLMWQAWLESDEASCRQLDLAWRYEVPVPLEVREATGSDEANARLLVRWIRSGYDDPGAVDTVLDYEVEHLEGSEWRSVVSVVAEARDDYQVDIPAPLDRNPDVDGPDSYRVRARTVGGLSFVSRASTWTPSSFWLGPNLPNPFSPSTTILYDVPVGGSPVVLRIFDLRGRLVRTLVHENQTAGRKRVDWGGLDQQGRRVASGIYVYELMARGVREVRRMALLD